jgi:hypothetical protein
VRNAGWLLGGFASFSIGAAVLWPHKDVAACSRASISAAFIKDAVVDSQIVAIGAFTDASERTATFRVDETLKGPPAGATVAVDNRTSYTYMACSPYDEPFHEGGRFKPGDTRILLLDKQVDGVWQVAFFGDAAWNLPTDDLEPLLTDFWNDGVRPPSLDLVRSQIKDVDSRLGTDLGWESRTPCNVVSDMGTKLASSTAVVIADVEPSEIGANVRVVEVLAGSPPKSFSLNTHLRRDYTNCDLVQEPQGRIQAGRMLLYLRPDEFGVADFRLAFWGTAHNEVNDRFVTDGLPTVRDIRDAVQQPPVTSVSPHERGSHWSRQYTLAVVALVAIALVGIYWRLNVKRSPR